MKLGRKTRLLIEPPSVATGDIAFNLLIFFLVCASAAPENRGRRQDIPRGEEQKQAEQSQNITVYLKRTTIALNAPVDVVKDEEVPAKLQALLAAKAKPEDKVVILKSDGDTPYERWVNVTRWVEEAGGTVTLQIEEESTVVVP
jgi:biopolymer transport protein ExbD